MVAETEAIAEADRRSQLAERAAAISHAVKVAAEQKKSRRRKERNMRGRGKNRNKKAKHQPGSADTVAGAAQDGETEQKMEDGSKLGEKAEVCMGYGGAGSRLGGRVTAVATCRLQQGTGEHTDYTVAMLVTPGD